jgi:hypothetical protein
MRFLRTVEKMRHEIDWGVSDVSAGDPKYLAPFFRIPGLARSDVVESELAARGRRFKSCRSDQVHDYARLISMMSDWQSMALAAWPAMP